MLDVQVIPLLAMLITAIVRLGSLQYFAGVSKEASSTYNSFHLVVCQRAPGSLRFPITQICTCANIA